MRFTNTSLKFIICALSLFLFAGCASKPERKVSMPSWVDIYDRSEDDEKESQDDSEEETFSPESSADASDRLKTEDTSAQDQEKISDEPEEKESSSLFDFFWGKKEPKPTEAKPEPQPEQPKEQREETASGESTIATDSQEPDANEPDSTQEALQSGPDTIATQPVEPEQPAIPKPKALTPRNEQQALEAKQANADYQRALKTMKAGNYQDALLLFQELNGRYPTLSGPIVNQAIILRKQDKLEQAKSLLQKAILNKTQNPYLMNELGLVNRALGNFEAAKQSYLSAIRLEPNYDKAHYNLGVLADLYLHDPALAYAEFEAYQALQEQPNKKVAGWLKEIKRRIQ